MHACGHDAYTAILLSTAKILTGLRDTLPGTVVFYFQPAEEGPSDFIPDGKNTWGAKMMVQEGVMKSPKPDAVFGLHVWAGVPAGQIAHRPGATLASSDDLRIKILGKQTHAGRPWDGIDPITVGAPTIVGLQTVVSRRTDIFVLPVGGQHRHHQWWHPLQHHSRVRGHERHHPLLRLRHPPETPRRRTPDHRKHRRKRRRENRRDHHRKYDPTINNPALTEKCCRR
jgi:amidohydrolase